MAVIAYNFKTGEVIKPYEKSPAYGRIILAEKSKKYKFNPATGEAWYDKTTRVAFIKGKIKDLEEDFGHLKSGQLFDEDLCIQKRESLTPFWQYEKKNEDGSTSIIKQPAKVRPATKDRPEKVITIDGKPVYMLFCLAAKGTQDTLMQATADVEEQDSEDLIAAEEGQSEMNEPQGDPEPVAEKESESEEGDESAE